MLAVVWLIGGYALTFGIVPIALGFRLRGWRDESGSATAVRHDTPGSPT